MHQDENKLYFCDTCSPSASSKHYSWLYLSIYPPIHLCIYLPACVQPSRKGHGFSSKEEGLGSNEQDPGSWPPKSSRRMHPWGPTGAGKKPAKPAREMACGQEAKNHLPHCWSDRPEFQRPDVWTSVISWIASTPSSPFWLSTSPLHLGSRHPSFLVAPISSPAEIGLTHRFLVCCSSPFLNISSTGAGSLPHSPPYPGAWPCAPNGVLPKLWWGE